MHALNFSAEKLQNKNKYKNVQYAVILIISINDIKNDSKKFYKFTSRFLFLSKIPNRPFL